MEVNKLKILFDCLIPEDSYFKDTDLPGIDKENPSYDDVKSLLNHRVHYVGDGLDKVLTAMKQYAELHVRKALDIAATESYVEVVDHEELSNQANESGLLPIYGVDEDFIRNVYPESNIE